MAIDASVFDRLKTFADYQKADQAFQLNKALQTQQLQTGSIDAATKSNVYATQVLSAAAANGDQNAYNQGLQTLKNNGIDVSNWAPDVQTGAQQAQAARLAQSPLGTLFGAQQKIISNNIAGTQAMGSKGAAADAGFLQPTIGIGPMGNINITPQAMPQPVPNITGPGAPQSNGAVDNTINQAMVAGSGRQTPAQLSDMTVGGPEPIPANLPAALPPKTGNVTLGQSIPRFSPPAQNPGETIAAYNQRAQQAFEAYKADPNYQAGLEGAKTAASEKAKLETKKVDEASVSQNTYSQLLQNINALKKLSPQIPDQGVILSPEGQAGMDLRLKALGNKFGVQMGGADSSNAIQSYNTISEQQVLNTIKQLVSSGQIRGNKFLEKIATQASIAPIDGTTTDAGRQQILQQIQTELLNSGINSQNQAAAYTGQPQQSYQPLPVNQPAAPSINPVDAINELKRRGKI